MMGYTTDFEGFLTITPDLKPEHAAYLEQFAETRRMKRSPNAALELDDPIRLAADLPIGVDGEFFVGGSGYAGQGHDNSILNYNGPPITQPGLWCKWTVTQVKADHYLVRYGETEAGTWILEWNGAEKFYGYGDWLLYLIDKFYGPWGYQLNGVIEWQGEERNDMGRLVVIDNVLEIKRARIVYD